MRESNFAFPTPNKACVCITSQLYDRRALDTTSPLPLLNSLTHLTYLTSTSPRIREIMTTDGGLERLVRILHDFCICPPPPDNAAAIYGLSPPNTRPPRPIPTLNPYSFDKQAAYRFSLAFQCLVNIGVRGSEPIRSRVVQAGTLDVVGCILEAWLANKGFAVGPSASAGGMPRETREQRQARRDAHILARQREQNAQLERDLQRRLQLQARRMQEDDTLLLSRHGSDTDMSTDASTATTPLGSGTPTGSVVFPSRDRSGTIIARPVWDPPHTAGPSSNTRRPSPPSTDTSRPETETEDDGDVDMESSSIHTRRPSRRAVGIVSDEPPAGNVSVSVSGDAHIVINVEDGIVSLEPNDDFAMGAPPGAPGALMVESEEDQRRTTVVVDTGATPRPGVVGLPQPALEARAMPPRQRVTPVVPAASTMVLGGGGGGGLMSRETEAPVPTGPYRDEDVLLSLQLLAYLSKYPHVRQAFYKQRERFHPATVDAAAAPLPVFSTKSAGKMREGKGMSSRRKEKEKERALTSAISSSSSSTATVVPSVPQRMTNVFSLVERFTFKPNSTESDTLPKLPAEIQYWAGVIMRNACRKDDSRGGVRQCANMLCGRWEKYPREFAKCRRCRKAKYCGKDCQSTAWSEGHRFWCSAKDGDGDEEAGVNPPDALEQHGHHHGHHREHLQHQPQHREHPPRHGVIGEPVLPPESSSSAAVRSERSHRDRERDRERETQRRERQQAMAAAGAVLLGPGPVGAERERERMRRGGGGGGGGGEAPHRVRGEAYREREGHRERERPHHHHHHHHQPVFPSRPRVADPRIHMQATQTYGAGYEEQVLQQPVGGRRRAETVTGVAGVGDAVGAAYLLQQQQQQQQHGHQQQQPPQGGGGGLRPPSSFFGFHMFGMGGGGGGGSGGVRSSEAGPSRWMRGFQEATGTAGPSAGSAFRVPVEENDMILG